MPVRWTPILFSEAKRDIEEFLGYTFNDDFLLRVALCANQGDVEAPKNARIKRKALAWLGDALLDLVLGVQMYRPDRAASMDNLDVRVPHYHSF